MIPKWSTIDRTYIQQMIGNKWEQMRKQQFNKHWPLERHGPISVLRVARQGYANLTVWRPRVPGAASRARSTDNKTTKQRYGVRSDTPWVEGLANYIYSISRPWVLSRCATLHTRLALNQFKFECVVFSFEGYYILSISPILYFILSSISCISYFIFPYVMLNFSGCNNYFFNDYETWKY